MKLELSQLSGLSDLTRDYLIGSPKIAPFFNVSYQDLAGYERIAEQLKATDRPHRDRLAGILKEQNRAFGAGQKTMDNIDRLANPNALAIVTGQQCGLFGGPLFIVYKSLTTIKLAREMEQRLHRPVVPVFYLVSEDHDFQEIRWNGFIDNKNQYQKLVYSPTSMPERSPAAEIAFDDSVNELITDLTKGLTETEYRSGILQHLTGAYHPDTHMHTAFARWYLELLGEYGLVVFDSADSRVKPLVAGLFAKELMTGFSNEAMSRTNEQLTAAGYHTQITVQPNRPNLFILQDGRHGLETDGDGFINLNNRRHYSLEKLLDHPENLSPKVTLRPLVQDSLFPTLAYVGGPGEIAYWAQLKGIYDHLNMTMPVVYPRAAFTLLEPRIRKHLDNYDLTIGQILQDPQAVIKNIMSARVPYDIRRKFDELQASLRQQFNDIKSSAVNVDPTLDSVFDKTAGNLENQVGNLQNKVTRAVEQREQVTLGQLESIMTHLLPNNGLQERGTGFLSYLTKYGTGMIDRLLDEINIGNFEHKIVEL